MAESGAAIIVGVGPGLGASLGRRFAAAGFTVAIASRTKDKVERIAAGIDGAQGYTVDAIDEGAVGGLFDTVEAELGPVEVCIFNASGRVRASFLDIDTEEFVAAWKSSCLGGFVVGREAARRMLPRGHGTIMLTGATASIKGFALSAGFATGKFGLRGMAQSMARELHPQGIHVAHVVVDGGIGRDDGGARLDPDAIAEAYYQLHRQPRSIWAQEIELRPWVEKF
jgi:NAD(P)-dependent dehydrogenase (short-subunit alcohol dehydrogenase family)